MREATHAFEFRLPRAPDAGDLRSGRRHPEVDHAGEAAAAVAPAARGGAPGDRSGARRRASLGQLPEPAAIAGAGEALARRLASGRVRAAAARALGQTRRDDALRRAGGGASTTSTRASARAVAAALGEFRGDEARGPSRWRSLAAPRRRQLLRRGRGGAGARAGPARRTRWRCCRRCSSRPSYPGRDPQPRHRGSGRAPATSARSRSCARPWRAGVPWVSRRAIVAAIAELARGTGIARAAREFIEARLADRDFGCAARPRWRWRRLGIDRGDRRAARRAVPPSSTAVPAGAWRSDPRSRGRHASQRGDPPPARRGRTPARPRPPSCANAWTACRPRAAAGRRPRRAAPKAKRPRPSPAARAARALSGASVADGPSPTLSHTAAARGEGTGAQRCSARRRSGGRSRGRAAIRRAGSRSRRRPGDRRRRSARRSC